MDKPPPATGAAIANMAKLGISAEKPADIAQMALDAQAANAKSFANCSGFRDTMIRVIRGAAAFRARIMDMTTEVEGGDHA